MARPALVSDHSHRREPTAPDLPTVIPTCFSSQRLLQPHALDLGSPLPLLHLLQLPLDGLQCQDCVSCRCLPHAESYKGASSATYFPRGKYSSVDRTIPNYPFPHPSPLATISSFSKSVHRYRKYLRTPKGKGRRGIRDVLGVWAEQIHTTIYKIEKKKDLQIGRAHV